MCSFFFGLHSRYAASATAASKGRRRFPHLRVSFSRVDKMLHLPCCGLARFPQATRPEHLETLIDDAALQLSREKRRKVEECVSEKVAVTSRMYDALDSCIKHIGEVWAISGGDDSFVFWGRSRHHSKLVGRSID